MAKKKKIVSLVVILVVVAVGVYLIMASTGNSKATEYQMADITRGSLVSTISANGSVSPVTVVEIGTQVSGILDSVFVDFNDKVRKGQLLAVLDTTLLKATVIEAEAGLIKAQAQMEQAEYDYDLYKDLYAKKLVSEAEFKPYDISVKSQEAAVKSAEASLLRARQNLEYAVITSPIDGIVIQKSIEAGQTVAASLSAPELFEIAQDLSTMEILVDVDESDIGQIKEGQAVKFEVATYSNEEFEGTVRQVRLLPETVSNVVTYTVVVDAKNRDNLLLPGMTATVDFIIEEKNDILMVLSKAFRYQPDTEVMQAYFEKMREQRQQRREGDSTMADGPGGTMGGGPPTGMDSANSDNMDMLWYLDEDGKLAMEPVLKGMSDGTNTEIVRCRNLKEGMQVISGLGSNGTTSTSSSQQRGPGGFGGPRRF